MARFEGRRRQGLAWPRLATLIILIATLAVVMTTVFSCDSEDTETTAPPVTAPTTEAGATTTSTTGAGAATTETTGAQTTTTAGAAGAPAGASPAIQVADQVLPSVVAIIAQDAQGQTLGLGSGVIYDAGGIIVTNNHVVVAGGGEAAPRLSVQLASGETLDATLVGRDPVTDLAVVKVERTDLPAARFLEDFSGVQVGEYAIAIGSPLGLEGTVTMGIVSAVQRELPAEGSLGAVDLIQTDAAISPGNSGGALANMRGEVIGINVAAVPPGSETRAQNLGFAIPSDLVIDVVNEIVAEGRVDYGYLGIQSTTITAAVRQEFDLAREEGVLLLDVQPDSPAADAGLQAGDIIVAIAGTEVRGQSALYSVLRERDPGDQVELTIVRGGNEQKISVTLGERPAA